MKRILAVMVTIAMLCGMCAGDAYQKGSFVKSLSAVTTTGAGTSFALPMIGEGIPSAYSWQVIANGANPTAIVANLEISLDGTHWFAIDSVAKADTAGTGHTGWAANGSDFGEMRWVSITPGMFVRCNLTTLTRSASETVTCGFVATKN